MRNKEDTIEIDFVIDQKHLLINTLNKILESQEDIPLEFAQVLNDEFWSNI